MQVSGQGDEIGDIEEVWLTIALALDLRPLSIQGLPRW